MGFGGFFKTILIIYINIFFRSTSLHEKPLVLDVGSCYNPFKLMEEFKVIGIDLHPATEVCLLYSENVYFSKTLSFSILTSIFLFLPNWKQQGVVLLKVACEFEYFSIQFPNKMFHYVIMFLSFDQEMILSINLTVQVNWFVCMKLAFSSLHALWKHPSFSHKFTL